MINDLEYSIYRAIQEDKKLTEIYLGYQEFEWLYTKAKYSATCTEAVDFTLFDKTICGLLNIEEVLSFEQIGEVLGFNVEDNPLKNKYKDLAESEILREALQSLEEFDIITTGDTSYSYCQLTNIGKEYFLKGKKFKIHNNKQFTLFFDNTNNNHSIAKDNFEFLKSNNVEENTINSNLNYEDEQLLKTFAENQIPEIYNVSKMNSFKDSELLNKEHRSTSLFALFLIDTTSRKYRTLVFEESSKQIKDYFTSYLNAKLDFKTKLFRQVLNKQRLYLNTTDNDFKYREALVKYQKEVEHIMAKNKDVSENKANIIHQLNFLEPFMFLDKLNEIISKSENEVWLMFNKVSSLLISILTKAIKETKDKYIFIYLPINDELEDELENLQKTINETKNSYLIIGEIGEFNVIINNAKGTSIYKKETVPLEVNDKSIKYQFVKKHSNVEIKEHIDSFRLNFANDYLENLSNEMDTQISEKLNGDLSSIILEDIENIDYKIRPFYNLTEHKTITTEIKENKNSLIQATKNARKEKIHSFTKSIFEEIGDLDLSNERKFDILKVKIKKEKENFEEFEFEYFLDLEKKLSLKEKEFDLIKKRKSIIIDTNVLIEEPNIIDLIGSLQNIIFSGKVIDELDGLKNRKETKEKAQEAIREIRKHQKNKNVSFNISKVANLPDDFNKKSPDNMILSVALQYKKRNPILLTNDKGLQIKAEMLDIPAKTIDELTSLLSLSRRSYANRKNTKQKKR